MTAIPIDSEPWFSKFVQSVPGVLKASIFSTLARTEVYKVSFPIPGDMMRAKSGGLRAIVVTDKGRIAAPGTLNRITALGRAAAVWEAAAFVVAQKYLSDIFKSLHQLNGGIKEVQRWLANERVASLQTNSKMLQEIETGLQTDRGFLAKTLYYQSALADIERDCGKIARASLLDIQAYTDDLENMDLSGWKDANPVALYEMLPKVAAAVDSAAFALVMRMYNTGLLSLLLGDPNITELRSADISALGDDLRSQLDQFELESQTRITALNQRLRRQKTVQRSQCAISDRVRTALAPAKARLGKLPSAVESLNRALRDTKALSAGPLTLCVEVGRDGAVCRIVQAHQSSGVSVEAVETGERR